MSLIASESFTDCATECDGEIAADAAILLFGATEFDGAEVFCVAAGAVNKLFADEDCDEIDEKLLKLLGSVCAVLVVELNENAAGAADDENVAVLNDEEVAGDLLAPNCAIDAAEAKEPNPDEFALTEGKVNDEFAVIDADDEPDPNAGVEPNLNGCDELFAVNSADVGGGNPNDGNVAAAGLEDCGIFCCDCLLIISEFSSSSYFSSS